MGVAERLTAAAQASLHRRAQLLHSDLATLRLVDDQMAAFMKDMLRDVERERLTIDKCLRWVCMCGGEGVCVLGGMDGSRWISNRVLCPLPWLDA